MRLPWSRPSAMTGWPTSANGASSFHLWWDLPAGGPWREMAATVEIRQAPARPVLYFWALQVSFVRAGRRLGGAHTGLQWHPLAPGGAVNWGGYGPSGGELAGRGGDLAPVDSANTRHWAWQPGRRYRLRVWSPGPGLWRSTITDLVDGRHTDVRDLQVEADELVEPVVWAEVFARCDDPPTEAHWSDLQAIDAAGHVRSPSSVRVSYQSRADGGCANTEVSVEAGAFVQRTGLERPRGPGPGVLTVAG